MFGKDLEDGAHFGEEPQVIAKLLAYLVKTAPDQSQPELSRGRRRGMPTDELRQVNRGFFPSPLA